MAKWSAAREQAKKEAAANRIAVEIANTLARRFDMFKAFRTSGWQVNVVLMEKNGKDFTIVPDDTLGDMKCLMFLVKMPGSAAVRVYSDGLARLAKGVGYGA